MGRALGTNFEYAFSAVTPPLQRTCLDFNVQARWRGGVVFEKGTPKFVPRARPAAGYLRSGGWGWLAHFADIPLRLPHFADIPLRVICEVGAMASQMIMAHFADIPLVCYGLRLAQCSNRL